METNEKSFWVSFALKQRPKSNYQNHGMNRWTRGLKVTFYVFFNDQLLNYSTDHNATKSIRKIESKWYIHISNLSHILTETTNNSSSILLMFTLGNYMNFRCPFYIIPFLQYLQSFLITFFSHPNSLRCFCLSFSASFLLSVHSLIQQYPSLFSPNNSAISPSHLHIPSHFFAACSSVSIPISYSLQYILSPPNQCLFATSSLPHLTLARTLIHFLPLFFSSNTYFGIPFVLISLYLVSNRDPSILSFLLDTSISSSTSSGTTIKTSGRQGNLEFYRILDWWRVHNVLILINV